MDYKEEIINRIRDIEDIPALVFIFGIIDEMIKHLEEVGYFTR